MALSPARRSTVIAVLLLIGAIWLLLPKILLVARIFGPHSGVSLTQPEALALHEKDKKDPRVQVVPKIIHQIYHNWADPGNETLPADWAKLQATIIKLNPEYEYKLWNDETSRTFFQDEYPWFLPVYDQLPEKVQKVDILKYFLMRHYGGIYIDLDNGCQTSLDALLYYPVFLTDGGSCSLSNNILGATPNHPFWVMFTDNLAYYCHDYFFPYVSISLGGGQWYESLMWEMYHDLKPANDPPLTRLMIDNHPGYDASAIFTTGRGASWHSWDSQWYSWMWAHCLQGLLGLTMFAIAAGLIVNFANSVLGQRNEEHFDKVASNIFSEPWVRELTNQVSNELQEQVAWIKGRSSSLNTADQETKMLDYACGDGMVSRALAKYISKSRGIDISSGMVAQYNARAASEGYSQDKMHAVHGDLITADTAASDHIINTPEYNDFDLAVISLALHHVENPQQMVSKLADRLADGGVLLIIDWVSPSESGCQPLLPPPDSDVQHTVSRMGFEEKEVRGYFEQAGLSSIGWRWCSEKSKLPEELGGQAQLFMARAERPKK
ncbi:unnamed protein product [Clonostachys rhizophaga]|uniref:Methyltransferase type 12 domain-containing protein n=1 Tax=Clonostachys rhizophaga TaxID=160324 RepID=A0A9N9VAH5_9HYPO|nr:unnamed protein product [Clonostachys rhizophaga]